MADDSGHLVTEKDGTKHLPTRKNGKPDHRLMGAAWAALHGGYRGNKYEGPGKEEAIAKLKRLYHSEGMECPGASNRAERLVILNRSVRSRPGWIHIVPAGELPNQEAGIVQVLDDAALDSIYNRLTAAAADPNWPGLYAGREHFIYNDEKDSEALAWFRTFNRDDAGIWAGEDGLTDIGKEAVKNKRYKFTSFVANRGDLQKLEGARYRVLGIDTVGFTNFANGRELLAPAMNRDIDFAGLDGRSSSLQSAANQHHNQRNKMQSIAVKLGLAAEASEDAILAEVTKIQNRVTTLQPLETENTTLKNRVTELETEQCEGLLDTVGVDARDARRPRLKAGLALLKNREDRLGYLKDFGLEPGKKAAAPGAQVKLFNRDAKAPAGDKTGTGDDEAAQKTQADRIMNRAHEIRKQTPSLSLPTAVRMAQREMETAA
ncbi:MAG: hypothetical protein KGL39_33510 [Patescibacteria group bacterium]|nr:hypothetical protein [Patescibacteria group bacterium]